MKRIKKLIKALKAPKPIILICAYLITIASVVGVIISFLVGIDSISKEIISYVLYAISAISLTYSVYTIVIFAPKWKKSVVEKMNKHEFTRQLLENYGYRTIILSTGALLFGLTYAAFLIILCVANRSVWYGVLAGFYILISISRIFVVFSRKNAKNVENKVEIDISYAKAHRNCGILLIISTTALNIAVLQMIFLQRTFSYVGNIIYLAAAYAFYKITIAIINLFKKRSRQDLNFEAVRNINFADAAVSILALQTALLSAFGDADAKTSIIFNSITGGVVCILTLILGIAMVITATKALKKLKTEK